MTVTKSKQSFTTPQNVFLLSIFSSSVLHSPLAIPSLLVNSTWSESLESLTYETNLFCSKNRITQVKRGGNKSRGGRGNSRGRGNSSRGRRNNPYSRSRVSTTSVSTTCVSTTSVITSCVNTTCVSTTSIV